MTCRYVLRLRSIKKPKHQRQCSAVHSLRNKAAFHVTAGPREEKQDAHWMLGSDCRGTIPELKVAGSGAAGHLALPCEVAGRSLWRFSFEHSK